MITLRTPFVILKPGALPVMFTDFAAAAEVARKCAEEWNGEVYVAKITARFSRAGVTRDDVY